MVEEDMAKKKRKTELKVVYDTSSLFSGSEVYLLRKEVEDAIKEHSGHKDVTIGWYLPDIVRHERQYQMQKKALELLPNIERMERLLGHNLNITEDIVKRRVEEAIEKQMSDLNLNKLGLDATKVEWDKIQMNAVYRLPPFDVSEKEKGFKDAVIAETFVQLIEMSPKSSNLCRVVIVVDDSGLRDAIKNRVGGLRNVYILESTEELKGLINTLVTEVNEEFVNSIKEKVKKYFFDEVNKEGIYYKEKISNKIRTKHKDVLGEIPKGADERSNGDWMIGNPRFVKKEGQRVFWATRIKVEATAYKRIYKQVYYGTGAMPNVTTYPNISNISGAATIHNPTGIVLSGSSGVSGVIDVGSSEIAGGTIQNWGTQNYVYSTASNIGNVIYENETFAKGETVIEVLWSVQVTTKKNLRIPKIESIEYVATNWEK